VWRREGPVVSITPGDPYAALPGDPYAGLAAAIAAQAVRDLEAATRTDFGRVKAAYRRAAARRSRPNDESIIERWTSLQVRTAIDFFRSDLWYMIANALDLPVDPPAHVRKMMAETERRLRILDEIRMETKRRKEAVS